MDNVLYTVTPGVDGTYQEEVYSASDLALLSTFSLNSSYNVDRDFIELHVYSVGGDRIRSIYSYGNEKQLLDSKASGKDGASTLYIDAAADAVELGYKVGGITLVYNFLTSITTNTFFIDEISGDRLELRAKFFQPSEVSLENIRAFLQRLRSSSYLLDFRLNFLQNNLLIGINLDLDSDGNLLIKLYEPLPAAFDKKAQFTLVEVVADSVAFEVSAEMIQEPVKFPTLRSPNFNIEIREESIIPTEYLDYNELYSYPITGSFNSLILQNASINVDINVDYTSFENFIHFSSAKERLDNFIYKVGLIEYYQSSSANLTTSVGATAQVGTSQNTTYYNSQISGIISKFDGFEKYLYFESSSFSYPKATSTRPYINLSTASIGTANWYTTLISSASIYDELNENNLVYTVPEFIRQDTANAPYTLFLNMIGQHFDNLWIYSKAVTDKYNADNRLEVGVSKDLIRDVLKSFGVKLYSSNFSVGNLASAFLGEWYDSGSEDINTFTTASNEPTPDNEILQETYKRIYHNLPYLIKTKGTERGLRALINCFGIPSGSLEIKTFGGVDRTALPYFGAATGSIDKIRLDNTGSIVPGDTLSKYTSIQNLDEQYTHDQHVIEVGFSPSYYIDKYIHSNITASFNIDQYIGDPRTAQDSSYKALKPFISSSLGGLSRYDLFDFVRLIKFYDNQVFKMVKDFVPARDSITTGIIIKPHILERSKVKQPFMSFTQPEFTGSIDTAFFTGSNGGVLADYSTAHSQSLKTIAGTISRTSTTEVERFNGELGGSMIDVVTGELNDENPFKQEEHPELNYLLTEYMDQNTPGPGLDEVDEQTFLTNPISNGNIEFFWSYNSKIGYHYIKYIRFRNVSLGGISIYDSARELEKLKVSGTEYSFISKTVTPSLTILLLADPGTGSSLNPASYPTTAAAVTLILSPYLPDRFDNSDYNPLLNNAEGIANSAKLRKVDYSNGVLLASNIQALRDNTADFADVQEYLYNSAGMVSGRYIGKQLNGEKVNVFNKATDRSYGNLPVVEQTVPYFGTFSQMSSTADMNNAVEMSVPYVTFQDGEVYSTSTNSDAGNDVPYIFTRDKIATLAFRTNTSGSRKVLALNGDYVIKQGGKRVEPILITQSGSFNSAGKLITTSDTYFDFITFGEDTGVDEYRLKGNFSGSTARATQVANSATLPIFFATQSFKGTSANWDNTDKAYSLSFAASSSIKYDTDVYFEFDRDGTSWSPEKISVDIQLEKYNGTIYETLQTKTIKATWNRYGVKHEQPEGIDIVGHYKTDLGIVKVFVRVSMSTGFIPFGLSGSTQKLRLKVVNNSTGNDDVYLLDYINGSQLGNKFKVEFRDQSRTADPNGELRVIFGPKFTNLPFSLKSNFRVDQLVKPQAVVDNTDPLFYPILAPSNVHPTASSGTSITSGLLNPYVWVSSSLTENFGLFQGSGKQESLGFKKILTPFTIQVGDEIRAEGSEDEVFTVVDIFEKGDSRVNDSHLFANRSDKGIVLIVEPPILRGTVISNALLRRYVNDPTKVMLFSNDPQTVDEFGTITPQFISQDLRTNFEKFSTTAFTLIS